MGFALFEEGCEAFLEVASIADAGVFENGALEVGVDTGGSRGGEQALGAGDAAGAGFDKGGGQFAGAELQMIGRDDFVNQAELFGFVGVK